MKSAASGSERDRGVPERAPRRQAAAVKCLLAGLILFTGCLSTGDRRMDAKELQELTRTYFEGYFAFHPVWATNIGIHDHDGQIDDWSAASIKAAVDRLRSYEERLSDLDADGLSRDDRLDLLTLKSHIQAELFDLEEMRPFETNPIHYNEILAFGLDELLAKNFAPKADRLRRMIERESEFPRFLAQARENLKNPPRVFTEKAIELVGGTITFLRETLPKAVSDVADPELQAAFQKQNQEAIAAVEAFLVYLREDLLPRSGGDFALGPERFRKKLLLEEMVDHSLEKLRSIGDEQLRLTEQSFVETAKRIDPEADPREVFRALSEDHATAEELIPSTAETLEAMRQFLIDREIVTLPSDERCTVVPMPPFMWGFAAMNSPGPLEKVAKEAYYYVDPVDDDWSDEKKDEHLRSFNRPTMEVISIHEAYPGHYVHGLFLSSVPSLVRKVLWSYTFGEGWAHYCEQMMIDEGYGGDDPRLRLAQLGDALIRLSRYRVALGLHTEGMTVDEAQAFFQEHGLQDAHPARREAIRGTFDPLFLSYTLGKLQILKLREDFRARMGDEFSLRDFHDRLLSVGSVPLRIAREALLGEPGPDL